MRVITNPSQASDIANSGVKALIELRLSQLGHFDPDEGMLIVVEDDSIEDLERVGGVSILYDPFEQVHYGDPDFTPSFDFLEEFEHVYELHYETGDTGIGVTFFLPKKAEGAEGNMLAAFCREYAVPAQDLAISTSELAQLLVELSH